MFKTVISIIIFAAFIFTAIKLDAGIANTRHNLSVTGPGDVKATTETQICVFCHTPHAAIKVEAGWTGPLWNHSLSTATYIISDPAYSREFGTGLQLSTPVQPDKGSKLCLSCHDGTVALGAVYNSPGTGLGSGITMTYATMPSGRLTNLGTDIRNTHLVSIAYNQALVDAKNQQYAEGKTSFQWKSPSDGSWIDSGHKIRLKDTAAQYNSADGANQNTIFSRSNLCSKCGIQCTTCHDPHLDTSAGYRNFVVADYDVYNLPWTSTVKLCEFCHY